MKRFALVAVMLVAGGRAFAETPRQVDTKAPKDASLEALKSVQKGIADREALGESLKVVRSAIRKVEKVAWDPGERKPWVEVALGLLKVASAQGRAALESTPPDLELAARSLQVAKAVSVGLWPEEFPAADCQVLARDADDALDKWLCGEKPPKGEAPKDLLADAWKWAVSGEVRVTKTKESWVLENAAGKPGSVRLTNDVCWTDYRVAIDFTTNAAGFQLLLRQKAEATPAAQNDIQLLVEFGVIEADKPNALDFLVFGSKFLVVKDGKHGKPQRCAPGSNAGGFSFRVPPGAKVTIRRLEVTVFDEEE